MATFDDVGARVICGNLHPDHSTVAHFVRRHARAICGLLPESVKACAREGLVSLEVVAGDGTKLKASASKAANVTGEELEAQIAELEELIAAGVAAWVAEQLACDDGDAPGPRAGGGDGPGTGAGGDGTAGRVKAKKTPERAAQTLARRKAARGQLAARQAARSDKEQGKLEARAAELTGRVARKQEAAERAWQAAAGKLEAWEAKAAAGRPPRGRKPWAPDADRDVIRTQAQLAKARAAAAAALAAAPAPDGAALVNTTDWTSRIMPLKKGGFDQLFNVQALATAGRQVIIAIMRHDNPADTEALHPLLEQGRAVLDAAGITAPIVKAAFDTGYASDANFTAAGGAELYVALGRQAGGTGRAGRDPAAMTQSWQDMAARLGTPGGKAVYGRRAATIEPVFAQLTARLGRDLHYRGDMADAELSLWAASHNLLKAIKAATARQARAVLAPAA